MNILLITPAYHPAVWWGGPIVSVHLLAKELIKAGDRVDVFTTTLGVSNITQHDTLDGVRVCYFRSLKLHKWMLPLSMIRTLWKDASTYEVIHLSSTWDPIVWLAGTILILKRKKYILSPRGSLDERLIETKSRSIKTAIYVLLMKRIIKRAACIHFTSDLERQQFRKYTGLEKQSIVIYNPLETDMFTRKAEETILGKWGVERGRYFLYLGRLNWKKGLKELIRGFASLDEKKDFKLVVAGPDEDGYLAELERLVVESGIEGRVVFTGLVEGEDKAALLQNAFYFVLASMSENFAIVAAESLACGTPVLISDGVGMKELVEKYDCGLIIKPDEQSVRAALGVAMGEEATRERRAKNARRAVEDNLAPRIIASRMREEYCRILRE